jgi:hypothetical protein
MIFSGLKLCNKCGVYEYRKCVKYHRNKELHIDIYYWSALPKYKLEKAPCPSCKPKQGVSKVSRYYG